MFLLRRPILALSASTGVKDLLTTLPATRSVVERFVAGPDVTDAVRAVGELHRDGLTATLDHLGEYTTARQQADTNIAAYLELIDRLAAADLAVGNEMSLKLSALGAGLPASPEVPAGGEAYALAGARRIVRATYDVGGRVSIDMEDHSSVDTTLRIVAALRADHPDVGVAIQAMLRRSEDDLRTLIGSGSRVRLVKGAYDEPPEVAYSDPVEVDRAYVRGLRILMEGDGYPMVGSHDPRLIAIAITLAARTGRNRNDYEFQMLYGIRPEEQQRLVGAGHTVRVYVPYGSDWYGYFTRRLAERPANLLFFLRSLTSRS